MCGNCIADKMINGERMQSFYTAMMTVHPSIMFEARWWDDFSLCSFKPWEVSSSWLADGVRCVCYCKRWSIKFYRQFKPLSWTSLNMFPTICFNTVLGEYPVILDVPLHKNVSLSPAARFRQKQGAVGWDSPWLLTYLHGGQQLESLQAPKGTQTECMSLWLPLTCMLIPQYSVLFSRFARLSEDNCWGAVYCLWGENRTLCH